MVMEMGRERRDSPGTKSHMTSEWQSPGITRHGNSSGLNVLDFLDGGGGISMS